MKTFAINGIGGGGKDTFVNACNEVIPCGLISTIDCVKLMLQMQGIYRGAYSPVGWKDEIKGPAERRLLSQVKIALMEYDDYPIKSIEQTLFSLKSRNFPVAFIMVREFSEMMKIVQLYKAETICIKRDNIPICATEQSFLNQIPKDYAFDYVFENNGTEDEFKTIARHWIQQNLI